MNEEVRNALMYLGFSRPCANILGFLMATPGPNSVLEITKGTNFPQPTVCLCGQKLKDFLITVDNRVAGSGKGRCYKTYEARPSEEIRQMLLFMFDQREKELNEFKQSVVEGI